MFLVHQRGGSPGKFSFFAIGGSKNALGGAVFWRVSLRESPPPFPSPCPPMDMRLQCPWLGDEVFQTLFLWCNDTSWKIFLGIIIYSILAVLGLLQGLTYCNSISKKIYEL